MHNNINRLIGTRITDNTSSAIIRRDNKDDMGVFEMKEISEKTCNFLQYKGAPEVKIDKSSGNQLKQEYFISMFNQIVQEKINDQMVRLTRLLKFSGCEKSESIKH